MKCTFHSLSLITILSQLSEYTHAHIANVATTAPVPPLLFSYCLKLLLFLVNLDHTVHVLNVLCPANCD